MPDSKDNLKYKVHDWLNKSGYPLELLSHERLVEYGYLCEKSTLYKDVETGVDRELDVYAEKSYGHSDGHDFSVVLLVECKKSEKPLVVLSATSTRTSVRSEIYGARVWPSQFNNASVLAGIGHDIGICSDDPSLPFSTQVRPGYSIVQAFKTSDEVLHKTLYGLAKAEHYFETQHEGFFERSIGDKDCPFLPVALHISLLAVDCPLFNAFLDEGELKVEETDWASVTLNLPWIPRPSSDRRANVQIVAKGQLSQFLSDLDAFANWLGNSKEIENRANQLA